MSEPDYLGYKLKLKISSHISQATQWNDTRNIYKLPVNQNEINKELRQIIINTIQMPQNWVCSSQKFFI